MKNLIVLVLLVTVKALAIPVIKIPPAPRPFPPPIECATAPYTDLIVDTTGRFKTIQQANEHARNQNICKVSLKIAGGTYVETINIERPTQLTGIGRVVLKGGVLNPAGYELIINGLEIFEAKPIAIQQSQGKIEIKNTKIISTGAIPSIAESGIGILLLNTKGSIENTTVVLSQKQALQISGPTSNITIKNLRVENTGYDRARALALNPDDPNSFHLLGAMEVVDGARVSISNSEFERNSLYSINVLKSGILQLDQVRISNTLAFDSPRGFYLGGTGIILKNEAKVHAERIIISGGLIGVISSSSYVTLQSSRVEDVEFGLGVAAANPEFNTYHCTFNQGTEVSATDRPYVALDSGALSMCHANAAVCKIPCP